MYVIRIARAGNGIVGSAAGWKGGGGGGGGNHRQASEKRFAALNPPHAHSMSGKHVYWRLLVLPPMLMLFLLLLVFADEHAWIYRMASVLEKGAQCTW